MGEATLDVVGVGNAIVDVLAEVDDHFIYEHDLATVSYTHLTLPTTPYV